MNCPICNQDLPEKAKFCYKCKNQVVCHKCEELLLNGAEMCVYCGTSIDKKTSSTNKFELKEDKESRSVIATFSDNTADSLVNALTHLFSASKYGTSIPSRQIQDIAIEERNDVLTPTTRPIIPQDTDTSPEQELLEMVFQYRGEELLLHETELKGTSRSNYVARLILLYLLYMQLNGAESVLRSDLL